MMLKQICQVAIQPMCKALVSITVLSWNCWRLLSRCIESIQQHPPDFDYEIIVVDNGSTDGTVLQLRTQYPDVQIIVNDSNRGVGPARNQAMEQAKGSYIINLDADIIVGPGSLNTLIEYMDAHPTIGLGGPKLLYPSGELQYSCRRFPTIFSKISRRIKNSAGDRILAVEYYADWDHNEPRIVDYVIGACQVIRREVAQQVGFYDENIFYGPEDIEYCWRIGRAGHQVAYIPAAVMIHYEQRITKKKIMSRVMLKHAIGLVYYFAKVRWSKKKR